MSDVLGYTRRTCDECGRGMQPYWPRQRVNDKLMCPMCATNEGFRMSGMVRVAVRHHQGAFDKTTTGPRQGIAHFLAADQPNIVRIAHDSGDSVTVFHCPFCGSGQVIARSDGSIECEFCHSAFTVQVQPEFSAFPQTIGGVPVDVPGMGPDQQPMDDPGAEQDMGELPPGAQTQGGEEEPPPGEEDEDGEEEEEDVPAFMKKSFLTESGARLDLEHYLQHLALKSTENRQEMLAAIQASNFRSR